MSCGASLPLIDPSAGTSSWACYMAAQASEGARGRATAHSPTRVSVAPHVKLAQPAALEYSTLPLPPLFLALLRSCL